MPAEGVTLILLWPGTKVHREMGKVLGFRRLVGAGRCRAGQTDGEDGWKAGCLRRPAMRLVTQVGMRQASSCKAVRTLFIRAERRGPGTAVSRLCHTGRHPAIPLWLPQDRNLRSFDHLGMSYTRTKGAKSGDIYQNARFCFSVCLRTSAPY
ncbi:hypothetical protein GCM10010249_59350 [Streptomyces roseolilacinus]|uniref:Uncharacterized protein n=1 Tax=Streptomyces roseolilacinus TaxID=66904 RepID=A0A918ENL0_9ACTN|nr:hypothetical protein GCM10010249_59350 [Streptomyces roseolilacinus]